MMKIIVSILIGIFLFTGCSTKDKSLSLDLLNKDIQLKNSTGVVLFVAERKKGETKHNAVKGIDHVKLTLIEEGFKLTNYKAQADFVFILDDASTKFKSHRRHFFNKHGESNRMALYGMETLTLKFLLTKPQNVSSYDYKIKNEEQVSLYTDSVSWQKMTRPYTIEQSTLSVVEENENFRKAYPIITKKILVQMDQEYVFDD